MAGKDFNRGALPVQFGYARQMRKEMTPVERLLWQKLRGHKLLGLRFRRQHPVGKFILDFYCHQINLGIEVDGEYHENADQQEHDLGREYELKELGITILRFSNTEIETRLPEVLNKLVTKAQQLL